MFLSDFTVNNKYARLNRAEQRKESYDEIVKRNKAHNMEVLSEKAPWVLANESFMKDFDEAYEMILNKDILPSMRSMQFAGPAAKRNEARIYNCSYRPADSISIFSETMFLLLAGVGVGYSVQQHHIKQLPKRKAPDKPVKYLIEDSTQGWSEAVRVLVEAYLLGKNLPVFDYSDIREKGVELVTSGGKAPGPEPLRLCLFLIEDLLKSIPVGNRLKSIDVHDILCHIADAVLAGGIRRAAMISLFSYWDTDMLNAKSGEWWLNNLQRSRANNSVVLLRQNSNWVEKVKSLFIKRFRTVTKKQFDAVFDACKNSFAGEPGFFLTNNCEIGTNPCGEISLYPYQFCNLVELNGSKFENTNDAVKKAMAATLIACVQSLHTDFHYLDRKWIDQTEKERLIGVGITGICSIPECVDKEAIADAVYMTSKFYSDLLKINAPARTTTVKPSGTTSCVLSNGYMNCPSGIHAGHSQFFIRRARLNANDPMVDAIKKLYPDKISFWDGTSYSIIEPDERDPKSYVVSFPMKSLPGSINREDETALKTLARIYDWSENYVQRGHRSGENFNNVSCTVNVKDDEWEDVRNSMWNNLDLWTAISLLPYDGGTYVQAPFEEIREEVYTAMVQYIESKPIIDFSKIEYLDDNTDYDLACSDGKCDINLSPISTIEAKRDIEEAF